MHRHNDGREILVGIRRMAALSGRLAATRRIEDRGLATRTLLAMTQPRR